MRIQPTRAVGNRRSTGEPIGGQRGFTLIEILVIMTIMAILATIVLMAIFNGNVTSARATCRSDFKTVETAVEAYRAQVGNYPSGSAAIAGATPYTDTDSGTSPHATVGGTVGTDTVNAAGSATSELMVSGDVAPNTFTVDVGPWLKDIPVVSGHFSIFVANDGTGHVLVLNDAGKVTGSGANSSFSLADCDSVQ